LNKTLIEIACAELLDHGDYVDLDDDKNGFTWKASAFCDKIKTYKLHQVFIQYLLPKLYLTQQPVISAGTLNEGVLDDKNQLLDLFIEGLLSHSNNTDQKVDEKSTKDAVSNNYKQACHTQAGIAAQQRSYEDSLFFHCANLWYEASQKEASARELSFLVSIFYNLGMKIQPHIFLGLHRCPFLKKDDVILEHLAHCVTCDNAQMDGMNMVFLTQELLPSVLEKAAINKTCFYFPNHWCILLRKTITKNNLNPLLFSPLILDNIKEQKYLTNHVIFILYNYIVSILDNKLCSSPVPGFPYVPINALQGNVLFCDFAQAMQEPKVI
jgi:hypothetical protein